MSPEEFVRLFGPTIQQETQFRGQAFGAPRSPDNQALLDQFNAPLPDYMGEIRQIDQQFQRPRMGYLDRFAGGLANASMPAANDFAGSFLQGAARSFAGNRVSEINQEDERRDTVRRAASDMARHRWSQAADRKKAAQNELEMRGRAEATRLFEAGKIQAKNQRTDDWRDQTTMTVPTPQGDKKARVSPIRLGVDGKSVQPKPPKTKEAGPFNFKGQDSKTWTQIRSQWIAAPPASDGYDQDAYQRRIKPGLVSSGEGVLSRQLKLAKTADDLESIMSAVQASPLSEDFRASQKVRSAYAEAKARIGGK